MQGVRAEALTVWVNALVESAGGSVITGSADDPENVRLGLTEEPARLAAEVIRSIADAGVGGPGPVDRKRGRQRHVVRGERRRFHGQLAVRLAPSPVGREGGTLDPSLPDDYGWTLYPRVRAEMPSAPPYGGINIGIGAFSRHPDFAFEAAECATSEENQSYYFVTNGNPASKAAVYDDPAVVEAFPMAPVIRESLEQAAPRPQTAYYSEISSSLQRVYHPPGKVQPGKTGKEAADLIQGRPAEGEAAVSTTTLPPGEKVAPAKARARVSDRTRAERRLGWMLAGPAFLTMLAVTAYPILQAVYDSLFDFRLTDPDNRAFTGLSNYLVILTDQLWWTSIAVTLFITVVTVAVELVLGFALALVMMKALKAIRPVVRAAILIPYAVITVVSAFSWQYAFDIDSGFVNSWLDWLPGVSPTTDWFGGQWTSLFVVCVAEIWKTTPFISLLLLAGLAQVPDVLQEAAKVDGATWWQRLTRVTIPNMKAAIMVALLFRTLDAFRVFDSIFVMTGGANNTETVSFLAYRQTIARLEIGLGSAVSVLLFLSVVLISALFIKGFKVDLASTRGE